MNRNGKKIIIEKKVLLNSKLWPEINDLKTASQCILHGVWVGLFVGTLTLIFILLTFWNINPLSYNQNSFLDVALLYISSFFIWYFKSRVASILGLIIYLTEAIVSMAQFQHFSPLVLVFILAYANSIRGTFAYHRFKNLIFKPNL